MDVSARYEDAKRLLEDRNWQEALNELRDVLRDHPQHRSARIDMTKALIALGRAAEALPLLEAMKVEFPADWERTLQHARALFELERYEEALVEFRQAGEELGDARGPSQGDVWAGHAATLSRLGRYEQSLYSSQLGFSTEILVGPPWYRRACALSRLGDPERARLSLAVAIAIDRQYIAQAMGEPDFDGMRDARLRALLADSPPALLVEGAETARKLWKEVRRWGLAVDASFAQRLDAFADALLNPSP